MTTQTRDPNFTIRPAIIKDTALILRFIRELADYEKLLHEVVADEATLKESLFGDIPHAKVVIGEYNDVAVSFALYFHNFSTFLGRPGIYLEDLYVQPNMRSKGLGKILLGYLASIALELKCGRLEWWVLDWNKSAIDFYQSLGAESMDEWTVNRVTDKALDKLAQQL
ncbi:MAG: GNAT superfamily N-acetyltransferase [Paraglaciecola sp.]|jgi:GNAT superfamily N-acetyltransferase